MQLTISENLQQKLFVRSSFEFAYRIPRMKLQSVDKYYLPELTNRFFDTLSIQKGLGKILIDFSSSLLQVTIRFDTPLILSSFLHPVQRSVGADRIPDHTDHRPGWIEEPA
jgi:hypothetical protein